MKFFKESINWSGTASYPLWRSFGAAAGMLVPLMLGILSNHRSLAVAVAFGSFAISNKIEPVTVKRQLVIFLEETIVFGLAGYSGMALATAGTKSTLILAGIAAVVALIGGISRTMAKLTTQFTIIMIIATHMDPVRPAVSMITIMCGATYTALVCIVGRLVAEKFGAGKKTEGHDMTAPKKYTPRQLYYGWRKKLTHFTGWLYAIRIGITLLVAGIILQLWPMHHGYWVLLTVAIVLHRNPDMLLQKAFQRMTGTLVAVLLAECWFVAAPPLVVSICLIGIVAFFRPLLNAGNYMAYAASTSLLVILLFSIDHIALKDLFVDRMLATFLGCALSLLVGYLIWRKYLPDNRVIKQ